MIRSSICQKLILIYLKKWSHIIVDESFKIKFDGVKVYKIENWNYRIDKFEDTNNFIYQLSFNWPKK